MKHTAHFKCIAGAVLLSFLLSSCGLLFPENQPKPRAKAKPHYSASEFVENLALSRLKLSSGTAEIPVANLEILNAYNAQRKNKPASQTLVLIEYKVNGEQSRRHVVAPVAADSENNNFHALLGVMNLLKQTPSTIYNIHLFSATIAPVKAQKIPMTGEENIKYALDQRQQHILEKMQKLSPANEVQLQLQLIAFFTEYRFRDAAYLCVENTKQTLAKATVGATISSDQLQDFSQRLETLESELHRALPFTLSLRTTSLSAPAL